jgi:DNA-binding response OmpR family regulator
MRALVIDDQREFFDSVRPTLTKSGFVSEYAPDISSAQLSLADRTFDLVLTDLQMAPGNWGGLEVIKTVRELDKVVPLFVVSGKGSLAECIQALRLGADDYIQKEVFDTEFIERAQPRFTRPYAVEHFPSLIAYLFRLFEEEQQQYTKARRLVDVYENTMKLLSLIIPAEQSPKCGVPIPPLMERWNLKRPALGSYVSFLFDQLGGDWSGNFLTALRASDLRRLRADCDRLTACRNDDFGHSTVVSVSRAKEIVETFSNVLYRLLNAVSFLRQFRLFIAYTLRYDGASFAAEGRLLTGSNLQHPVATIALREAIPTGQSSS